MANVWVVIKGNQHFVFTEKSDADDFGGDMIIAALFDPPVERTYRVAVAFECDGLKWEAEQRSADGYDLDHAYWGNGYHCWYIKATSPDEAIAKAKQLFRDSI